MRGIGYLQKTWATYERYGLPMEDMSCTKEVWVAHERYGLPMKDMGCLWKMWAAHGCCTRLCWMCEVAIRAAQVLNKAMVSYTDKAVRG